MKPAPLERMPRMTRFWFFVACVVSELFFAGATWATGELAYWRWRSKRWRQMFEHAAKGK